ncbi:MAG: hydroxymethylglutaryl-CoA lyase [Armatimonadetes bacterium CP1_7O]|nr:MAG: hydroxymethylglutaryl-CoA lyase [Armatimonadetes bacterium CP1_7O]
MLGRLPRFVRVVEVGARDGLQNEPTPVPTEVKVRFIEMLAEAGVSVVEATAFVSPRWVPQLADAEQVMTQLTRRAGVRYPVLVPNLKGLERALNAGATEIAIFTAASESFCQRNLNRSIEQSLQEYETVVRTAKEAGCWVRGYISTALVCPYEGEIAPDSVKPIVERLLAMGVDEVSLGDTIGAATPTQVARLTDTLLPLLPPEQFAYHFHNTYGVALANVLTALQQGIFIFDSSAGGLGGCPFAPGASGNLATEDLLYMLHGMGIETGVSLEGVVAAAQYILSHLQRTTPPSNYLRACPLMSPA